MTDTEIIAKFDRPVKIGNTEYQILQGKIRDSILVSNGLYYGSSTNYLVKFTTDNEGNKLKEPYMTTIKPTQITKIVEESW